MSFRECDYWSVRVKAYYILSGTKDKPGSLASRGHLYDKLLGAKEIELMARIRWDKQIHVITYCGVFVLYSLSRRNVVLEMLVTLHKHVVKNKRFNKKVILRERKRHTTHTAWESWSWLGEKEGGCPCPGFKGGVPLSWPRGGGGGGRGEGQGGVPLCWPGWREGGVSCRSLGYPPPTPVDRHRPVKT